MAWGGERAIAERFCRDLQAPLKLLALNERQERSLDFLLKNKSHCVTQASIKPVILLPSTPSAGIRDAATALTKEQAFLLSVLGVEPKASLMLGKWSIIELHPQPGEESSHSIR